MTKSVCIYTVSNNRKMLFARYGNHTGILSTSLRYLSLLQIRICLHYDAKGNEISIAEC